MKKQIVIFILIIFSVNSVFARNNNDRRDYERHRTLTEIEYKGRYCKGIENLESFKKAKIEKMKQERYSQAEIDNYFYNVSAIDIKEEFEYWQKNCNQENLNGYSKAEIKDALCGSKMDLYSNSYGWIYIENLDNILSIFDKYYELYAKYKIPISSTNNPTTEENLKLLKGIQEIYVKQINQPFIERTQVRNIEKILKTRYLDNIKQYAYLLNEEVNSKIHNSFKKEKKLLDELFGYMKYPKYRNADLVKIKYGWWLYGLDKEFLSKQEDRAEMLEKLNCKNRN
jgi:hypothetical protein